MNDSERGVASVEVEPQTTNSYSQGSRVRPYSVQRGCDLHAIDGYGKWDARTAISGVLTSHESFTE